MSSNLYDKTTQELIPYAGSNEATTASLDSLSNVLITSPTNGQLLTFDAESLKWKNADKENAAIEMSDISDVIIMSVSHGQILKWEETTGKWVNSNFHDITSLGAIPNVYLDELSDGQFLIYDTTSGKWINTTLEYQKPLVADYGISIDQNNNKIKAKTFVGTLNEWYSLSMSEQMSYDSVGITDDQNTAYATEIAYVDELPLSGIMDIIYGLMNFGEKQTTTAADGFLDSVSAFTKTTVTGGYKYTSSTAVISTDDLAYYSFESITYDGTKFIINWGGDWEEEDLALGDTFYYKTIDRIQYYAGHQETQSFHTFESDIEAYKVTYDNSSSGLLSLNVQSAVDELADEKADSATTLSGYGITDAYTKEEIDNALSELETNITWKAAVATYSDIATTYPNPQPGWTVVANDVNIAYRYTTSDGWTAISANATPEATEQINGLMTSTMVTKLNGIASGAEVNQNAFSNITVGSTTVAADSKTDTLTLVAGSNVTLTPDATNDKVTIAATNTTTGTTYAAGSAPANTTFGTNGSIKNAYDSLNSSKLKNGYASATTSKQGIIFDKCADNNYFTFRPYLPNNLLQVTKNDTTSLLSIFTNGIVAADVGLRSPFYYSADQSIKVSFQGIHETVGGVEYDGYSIRLHQVNSLWGIEFAVYWNLDGAYCRKKVNSSTWGAWTKI